MQFILEIQIYMADPQYNHYPIFVLVIQYYQDCLYPIKLIITSKFEMKYCYNIV